MQLISRGHEPDALTIQADAVKAFRSMLSGGVAVLPLSVSYAIFGHTAGAVERIYELKQRPQAAIFQREFGVALPPRPASGPLSLV